MRSNALFALAITFTSASHAQSTFEKFFPTGTSYKFSCHELASKNYFVGLGCSHGVSRLDTLGNIIQTHCYMPGPMVRVTSLAGLPDDHFLFATSYQLDSCTSSGTFTVPFRHPAIGIMDTLGNVLDYHFYQLPQGCQNSVGDFSVTADNGVVAWGSDTSFFAIRVDASLAGVWGKRFSRHGGFQFIKELPGGDLLAGINMDSAGAVVARLDADGNFLWCKSYIRPKGMVNDAIIESDESFIITGFTDSANANIFVPLPSTFQPKLFMMKLNGDGEVDWCRGYDSSPHVWNTPKVFRTVKTMDGNYMVLATLGYPGYNMFFRPLLIKTDQSGDTLWTSSVGYTGFDHYAKNLLECSDKGLLLSGYIWGDIPNGHSSAAFLFKTDSLGQFPCWERTHTVEVLDLFPTDSSFTLTSVDGILEQPTVVTDTIFPFDTYDGCTFTTGIPMYHRSERKLSLRPNPTTGRFTLEVQDALMADSYYSVFDAVGKLLYQRPLPAGATVEEIDLSRFGRGTYVLRLTDPQGSRYERMVLE